MKFVLFVEGHTEGKELFDKLDPKIAYSHCPKLKLMLDKMLELARSSYTGPT